MKWPAINFDSNEKLKRIFIYLAVPGLKLLHVGSLVVVWEHLVMICSI